jgi:hypothetical protein
MEYRRGVLDDEDNQLFRNLCHDPSPYRKKERIEYVLRHPIHRELQPNGRIRQWG